MFTFSIDSSRTVMLATLGAILLGPPSVERLASLQASNSLDRLAGAEIGDALPPGWRLRAVEDEPPALTVVVRTDDDGGAAPGKAIRMVAEDAAGQAWLELDDHLQPGEGLLSTPKPGRGFSSGLRPRPRRDSCGGADGRYGSAGCSSRGLAPRRALGVTRRAPTLTPRSRLSG